MPRKEEMDTQAWSVDFTGGGNCADIFINVINMTSLSISLSSLFFGYHAVAAIFSLACSCVLIK